MIIDKSDIENLLYLVPANLPELEALAPQEVARLAETIYNSLVTVEAQGYNLGQNFENWKNLAKVKIESEITDAAEFFGDGKIAQKLDISALLEVFYNFESGDFQKQQS